MKSLTAEKISRALTAGSKEELNFNRHQKVDKRVKQKQQKVDRQLRASGKAHFEKTMEELGR
jgi:hypothetical protein